MTGTLAPELTVADRCDRCGAQAFIRVRLVGDLELLFCGHHGREHLDKLRDMDDVEIHDESHRLVEEAEQKDPLS